MSMCPISGQLEQASRRLEQLRSGAPATSSLGPARFREPFPRSTRPVPRNLAAMVSGIRLSAARSLRGQGPTGARCAVVLPEIRLRGLMPALSTQQGIVPHRSATILGAIIFLRRVIDAIGLSHPWHNHVVRRAHAHQFLDRPRMDFITLANDLDTHSSAVARICR